VVQRDTAKLQSLSFSVKRVKKFCDCNDMLLSSKHVMVDSSSKEYSSSSGISRSLNTHFGVLIQLSNIWLFIFNRN